MRNERNTVNGGEVRQKKHDLLPKMRQKDFLAEQAQVRFLRLRQERQDEGLQVE